MSRALALNGRVMLATRALVCKRATHVAVCRAVAAYRPGVATPAFFSTKPEADPMKLAPPTGPDGMPTPSQEVVDIVDRIMKLPLMEIVAMRRLLATRMGLDPNFSLASIASAGGGGGGAADAAPAKEEKKEEKTEFNLKLTGFDAAAKIKVIKEVRAITGLGLKEAKDAVEGAPTVLKEKISKAEAEELAEKLKGAGATIAIE